MSGFRRELRNLLIEFIKHGGTRKDLIQLYDDLAKEIRDADDAEQQRLKQARHGG